MNKSIFTNADSFIVVAVEKDGARVPIAANAAVTAQLFSEDGSTALFNSFTVLSDTQGADWSSGLVAVRIEQSTGASLLPRTAVMLVLSGPAFVRRYRLEVVSPTSITRSALFIRDFVIGELRQDRLAIMAQSHFASLRLSDDFLWSKLVAAEGAVRDVLRVPLTPTAFFPSQPTQEQIDALAGMPWERDAAYDYGPESFSDERWGLLVTRQKPIISVSRMRFAYPTPMVGTYDIPVEWLRIDHRSGYIRIVPVNSTYTAPLNAFLLPAIGGARALPGAIELTYTAGLTDAATRYPQLLDAVKKMAVLKIIEDGFLPQSGSISADGLSESMSVNMDQYRDTVSYILTGPKGSNGGLMTAIHGVRIGTLSG